MSEKLDKLEHLIEQSVRLQQGDNDKLTWSHSGSESVWYPGKRLQVAFCNVQDNWVQSVGTLQAFCFVDAMSILCYSILLYKDYSKSCCLRTLRSYNIIHKMREGNISQIDLGDGKAKFGLRQLKMLEF